MKKIVSFTFSLFLLTFNLTAQSINTTNRPYVIKNVNVISMTTSNQIIKNASVVISNNIIQSINREVPHNCKVIDGKGKWLIPGLIDSHVHLQTDGYFGQKYPTQLPDVSFSTQDMMTPFIANGVTAVVDLNSTIETYSQKKEIEKGHIVGPKIILAALINGGNGQGRIANTPQEGRLFVRNAKVEGYDFIKLYSNLNIETYFAIIDESNKLGLKIIGHIPDVFQGNLDKAFVPHFGIIAHAEELSKHAKKYSLEEAIQFAKLAKNNGTSVMPTLTTMVWIAKQSRSIDSIRMLSTIKYMHPLLQSKWIKANNYFNNASPENVSYFDTLVKFHYQLIKVFRDAGVRIIAGTDAGVSGVVPGFSLHDELAELVKSGLTPYEALSSATISAAQWIGNDKLIGSIEEGKQADLILLKTNPLIDINNVRNIEGVFINGNWLDSKNIKKRLSDLSERNAKNKDKFDWKTFIKKKVSK